MKKAEFKKEVQEVLGEFGFDVNQDKAIEVSDALFQRVVDLVKDGHEVPMGVLGKMTTSDRAARKGVNPALLKELKAQGFSEDEAKQRAEIDIEASIAPKYKPSKQFKEFLNIN